VISLREIWLSLELGIKDLLKPLFQTKIKPGDIVIYKHHKYKGKDEIVLVLEENSRYKGVYRVLALSLTNDREYYPDNWTTGKIIIDWYLDDNAEYELIKAYIVNL
jgi:hypothetical protein